MSEMTLADMAREIGRRKPGALPLTVRAEGHTLWTDCAYDGALSIGLFNNLAHAILRDAMVMATMAGRLDFGWDVSITVLDRHSRPHHRSKVFFDDDHGDCPTRSLFAAFCAVFPEPKETPDAVENRSA